MYEYKILLSDIISIYSMFPFLLVEAMVHASINLYLMWTWFCTGQLGTIVNKLICIQTICGILLILGRLVDYSLRLGEVHPSSSSMLPSTYSSCWIVFYNMLIYMFQTAHLSMASFRWVCVKYPLEFHNR